MDKTNILLLLTPKNQVACLDEKMNVRQALEKMRAHGYNTIPLINKKGEYLGIISEGDLLWHLVNQESFDIEDLEDISIHDLARKKYFPPVKVNADIQEIADKIINSNFVPVVDDRNVLMGIITRKKVMQEIFK